MRRVPIESRALAEVGFEEGTLEVAFTNGRVYRFFGVPPEVHDELMAAESHGAYFTANVRDAYPFERRA